MSAFLKGMLIISTAALVSGSAAHAEWFYCDLRELYSVSDSGVLEPSPLLDAAVQHQIAIDRTTGQIVHPLFGTDYYPDVRVLDFGSSGSSFKSIAISSEGSPVTEGEAPFRNTIIVQVGVYAKAVQKPLTILEANHIGLGTCK